MPKSGEVDMEGYEVKKIKESIEEHSLWIEYLEEKNYSGNEILLAKGWLEALNWTLNIEQEKSENQYEIKESCLVGDD